MAESNWRKIFPSKQMCQSVIVDRVTNPYVGLILRRYGDGKVITQLFRSSRQTSWEKGRSSRH